MDNPPTERELDILKALWELGDASVRQVHELLAPTTGLHFNTIQTQLRIMDDKNLVTHRREGRTFIYRANCSRDDVSSRFLDKVFDGALDQLVLSMLNQRTVSKSELDELEALIAARRNKTASRKPRKGEH